MIPENNYYPLFEVNQVLSASHLNTLHDRLDEQNRLTRATLHGIGIVCGLEISVSKSGGNATIAISKGYGVTSEGYAVIIGDEGFQADRCRKLTIEDDYAPLLVDEDEETELLELLDSDHELYDDDDSSTIDATSLSGMAVLLYVERLETSLKTCTPSSCDDQGTTVTERVRKLLVPTSFLDSLHEQTAEKIKAEGDFFPNRAARLDLPDIDMPRFDVPATELTDTESILTAYKTILVDPLDGSGKSLFKRIAEALDAAREAFTPMLSNKGAAFTARLDAISEKFMEPKAAEAVCFQYYYGFLNDLIEAYNEFRWKALELTALCTPPSQLFPRHLELGELEAASGNTPSENTGILAYRHTFRPSPALGELKVTSREVQSLFDRLQAMIDRFDLPEPEQTKGPEKQIQITPGRTAEVPLSQRPIPCYYSVNSALLDVWDFAKTDAGRANLNRGYGVSGDDPLTLSFDKSGFFRIEGHLGHEWSKTLDALKKKIADYRLPFDVLVVKTETPPDDATEEERLGYLQEFVKKHPGIEHSAGVLPGGTFVMVCNSTSGTVPSGKPFHEVLINLRLNTIIADFSLPYRISETTTGADVPVGECEYHWIDSVRHLNNITLRKYRKNATPKAPASHEQERNRLATNYVVRIKRYEIQGRNLLENNSYVDVSVPLSELQSYGHAAIMKKLNEEFPLGVVFDHTAGTGNMLIRFVRGQRFRIELEGVQGNRIRYAYDQAGMYRKYGDSWDPVGTPKKEELCRMVAGNYDENVYGWLHQNFGQSSLTTIARPTAKEVIDWQKLALARARRYPNAASLPIASLLTTVAAAIRQIDPQAGIVLVGSWANGSWLSRIESENLESFGSAANLNTFRTLNKKVTGRSGYSDIDLLIDSDEAITPEMIRVTSGYTISMFRGKKDAQKGMVL